MFCAVRVITILALAAPGGVLDRPTFSNAECGLSFSMPNDWVAGIESYPPPVPDDIRCHIALRPKDWISRTANSRWSAPDPPLWLIIFQKNSTFEDALRATGFQKDKNGRGFSMGGGYGTSAPAEPYAFEQWSGLAAYTYFRSSVRGPEFVRENDSNLFSGEVAHIVLRAKNGDIVGFECEGGTPDETVECDPVIEAALRTLRLAPAQSPTAPPN